MRIDRTLAALLVLLAVVVPLAAIAAEENAEEQEEEPYDERGLVQDSTRVSVSFTSGSTKRYDYDDLRIYLSGNAHYAFRGDDYLDLALFVNKLERSYDDPRYESGDIRSIFDADLTYVFGGVDKYEHGAHYAAGLTLFSDAMFEDMDVGLGCGANFNYPEGTLKTLIGFSRNIGYTDSWAPLVDLGWIHTKRLDSHWTLRTRADVMWTTGRDAIVEEEGKEPEIDPDAIYLLDGTISYQLTKGWSLYARYFNDNSSDYARSYWSFGLSHYYRPPRRRPK